MDSIENEHVHDTIFYDWDQDFWWKRESWNKAKKIFGYKIDGWHLCKSAMIVCLILGAVMYSPIFNEFIDFLIFGAVWNITFVIFYSKLFKK